MSGGRASQVISLASSVLLVNALTMQAVAQEYLAPKPRIETGWGQPAPQFSSPRLEPIILDDTASNGHSNGGLFSSCSVSFRSFLSWGQSDRNHSGNNFGSFGFADPISDLRWKNTVSETLEIGASSLFFDKVVVNVDVGAGGISGGNFRDQDFLLSGRRAIFSDTESPINSDDLFYFNADMGWRFYEDDYCTIDGLIGYQYWSEKYVAEGGSVLPSLFPGPPLPSGPGITERFMWQGLRVGAQGLVQFAPRWTLKSRVVFLPITHLEVEDTHHNRTDFRQDPSGIDRATGGFGVVAEIRVTYWLWEGLFLEAGYRIFDATSGNGETRIRTTSGDVQLPFNEGNTTRQGLILGLTWQF